MYVCVCKAVTDKQINSAIQAGACSRRKLFECFGVGGDCGKCNKHVKELLLQSTVKPPIMHSAANDFVLNG